MVSTATNANVDPGWPFADNDRRKPHPPRFFTASSPADGVLRVRWTDQGSKAGLTEPHPVVVQEWVIYICPSSLAGSPSGADPMFKFNVLKKGHSIASMRSRGQGEDLTLTISDPSFADIYVLVVGVSVDNIIGVPSEPILLFAGVIPPGALNNVTGQALNLVAVTDLYGNHFVDLNPSYVAPLDLGRFFGVEIYLTGYLAESRLMEVGNLVIYQRSPPGQAMAGHIYLPRDEAHNAVTAYFVSVDRLGTRVDDVTTAPSVAVPGGIFA